MSSQWYEVLAAQFGRKLDEGEDEVWWKEMTELRSDRVHRLTNDEMCDAIRWAKVAGVKPKSRFDITAGDLMGWVRRMRRAKQREDEETSTSHCVCSYGWIIAWPELDATPTYPETIEARSVAVPCACDKGQALLNGDYHYPKISRYEKDKLVRLGRRAISQHASSDHWVQQNKKEGVGLMEGVEDAHF